MPKKRKPDIRMGRPVTGIRPGEKVSDIRRFAMRMPEDVRAELEAAAGALGRPAWRVVIDAIRAYVGKGPVLTDQERHAIWTVMRLRQS